MLNSPCSIVHSTLNIAHYGCPRFTNRIRFAPTAIGSLERVDVSQSERILTLAIWVLYNVKMRLSLNSRSKRARSSCEATSIAILLCLGVFMQLLGAPITLWDAMDSIEGDYESFEEGFAIPATPFLIERQRIAIVVDDRTPAAHSRLHCLSLFHPPPASFACPS